MTCAATPYFPYLDHRTMAEVMEDEAAGYYGEFQPNRYGKQGGNTLETKAGQNTVGAVPDPDQNRLKRSR